MKKRRLYVLPAALLVGVGTASYAIAGHDDGPGHVPNTTSFHAALLGYEETPSNSTTGFGQFDAKLDPNANTIHYTFSYSNLEGQKVTGGKILFEHVHFGHKGVAGASPSSSATTARRRSRKRARTTARAPSPATSSSRT